MLFEKINEYGKRREPFFFIIDFEGKDGLVFPVIDMDKYAVSASFCDIKYGREITPRCKSKSEVIKYPVSKEDYIKSFNIVNKGINDGNSYLLNLTFPTKILTSYTLEDIYSAANAKYKVYIKDKFTFFSPETFVKMENDKILSYPMKGTIDAGLDNAYLKLMDNDKELYEHYTIVDLIRNDLSMVAKDVKVDKFRYVDKIKTALSGEILQTSSIISGDLDSDWRDKIGDILRKLLPAGSISGAPKIKTLEIIKEAEIDKRGFYTGVTGIFDGVNLDSCVNL